MKKIINILTIILIAGFSSIAQNEVDALRFSQNFAGGTARAMASGGAFGSLGGDFSSISINPAGLGVYRSSEFTFTPTFAYNNANSAYYGTNVSDFKYNFNFNNMGIVGAYNSGNDDGWVTTNFAFGYNQLNNFHNQIRIQGTNIHNSLTDYFAEQANGRSSTSLFSGYGAFEEGLAWDAYLIDPDTAGVNQYVSNLAPQYGELQRKTSEIKGSIGEYVIALGGNYKHKLFIGGSIGIQTLRYINNSVHREIDELGTIDNFKEFAYNTNFETHGTGFNFKFGAIFRPIDVLRLGVAIHSPTFFDLTDRYKTSMDSYFDNGDEYHVKPVSSDGETMSGAFDYRLSTPFKAIGSLSFIIAKKGFVSVDYEFVDYRTARLRSGSYDFYDENDATQQAYRATGNLKAGIEYKLDNFALRGGYAMYGSPYAEGQINVDNVVSSISGGFGIWDEGFFFDMAYVYTTNTQYQYLYDPSVIVTDGAKLDFSNSKIMATFGFRF
ncbi:MAG: hypothetical protein JXR58_11265 [Bacteroidales bacterium]|nr:hypothetical protein [Bacteroidales bacterium]